jgi:hypothetical protein
VHCTRLNKRQWDALNDEKIICQLRLTLVKTEMPGLVPGIFIWKDVVKDRDNSGYKKGHQGRSSTWHVLHW